MELNETTPNDPQDADVRAAAGMLRALDRTLSPDEGRPLPDPLPCVEVSRAAIERAAVLLYAGATTVCRNGERCGHAECEERRKLADQFGRALSAPSDRASSDSDALLAEVERLGGAATPGPWRTRDPILVSSDMPMMTDSVALAWVDVRDGGPTMRAVYAQAPVHPRGAADRELIAEHRTLAPRLAALVRELQGQVKDLTRVARYESDVAGDAIATAKQARAELAAMRERAREDTKRLVLAEDILHSFKGVPCLLDLLGEDGDNCGCMGCASRAYFAAIDAARQASVTEGKA